MTHGIGAPSSEEHMLRWFDYRGRSDEVEKAIAMNFSNLATYVCEQVAPGRERTVALRKLLESMDAAMRAARIGGG